MAFSGFLHRDPDYVSLPDVIDEELLDQRVTRLRNGDMTVVKDIVLSLMRVVMGVVRDFHCNDDEVIGEALLTLQESVIQAATALHDNNIKPYVLKTVRMRLKDIQSEGWTTYMISARRLRERLSKGQTIPQRHQISEEDFHADELTYDRENHMQHISTTRLRRRNLIDPRKDLQEFELREGLEQMVRSHRQKAVVNLKLQEYTLKEIAAELKISEATAMRELHDLRERFLTEV